MTYPNGYEADYQFRILPGYHAGAEPKSLSVRKFGAEIKISEEQLFEARGLQDPRYLRRHNKTYTPAAPEAWERYRAAVAGLDALTKYEGTLWGGPDYDVEVPEPEPTLTIEYLETAEEWLQRCRAAAAEQQAADREEWTAAAGQWARRG